jgi:hypothetical protein
MRQQVEQNWQRQQLREAEEATQEAETIQPKEVTRQARSQR